MSHETVDSIGKYAYETSKSRTRLRRGARSGRPFKYVAIVPAQRLYWMVRRVSAAPSILAIGSVCMFQNLGERYSMSSTVKAVHILR
jgi:hypothetical protein